MHCDFTSVLNVSVTCKFSTIIVPVSREWMEAVSMDTELEESNRVGHVIQQCYTGDKVVILKRKLREGRMRRAGVSLSSCPCRLVRPRSRFVLSKLRICDSDKKIHLSTAPWPQKRSETTHNTAHDSLQHTTTHNTALHCTALHCTALHYTTLHYTTLHYTTLHYTTLHYTTLRFTSQPYTALHNTATHYTELHTAQQHTTLHYTGDCTRLHHTTPHHTTPHHTTPHYNTTHYTPLTTLYTPLTTHYTPLTTHHSPLTTHYTLLTIHHSPLATHYSLLTTRTATHTQCTAQVTCHTSTCAHRALRCNLKRTGFLRPRSKRFEARSRQHCRSRSRAR